MGSGNGQAIHQAPPPFGGAAKYTPLHCPITLTPHVGIRARAHTHAQHVTAAIPAKTQQQNAPARLHPVPAAAAIKCKLPPSSALPLAIHPSIHPDPPSPTAIAALGMVSSMMAQQPPPGVPSAFPIATVAAAAAAAALQTVASSDGHPAPAGSSASGPKVRPNMVSPQEKNLKKWRGGVMEWEENISAPHC